MQGQNASDLKYIEIGEHLLSATPHILKTWTQSALCTNQADPFCCTPSWQLSFHYAFNPNRRLLIKESSNNVIAFAEKVFSPKNIFLTPIEPYWFFGCPLMGRYSVELFSETIANLKRHYSSLTPNIAISGIRPNGALYNRLSKVFGAKYDFSLHSSGLQCAASLSGGLDGYLSRRSGNQRRKLKMQLKSARNEGIWFERIAPTTSKESEKTYSRMLSVELNSWKGISQCGMEQEPAKSFYKVMIEQLTLSREARVIFARHGNNDIGFIFGGMAGKIYRGQQFSYNENWKRFSIGNILQIEQIRWLCEEGAKRYDMGPLQGEKMNYKHHWTEKEFELETWILRKK